MNSRERVIKALNHQQPDRVPVDIGGTPLTGIAAGTLDRLRKDLGLEPRTIKMHEPMQMLGEVDEDVIEALGGDVIGLYSPYTMFGYKNEGWKPWRLPDGTGVLVGKGFMAKEGEDGDTYIYPRGDTSAAPSAKLPKGGYYFDPLIRQEEIDDEHMNGREDFKEQYTLFSEEDLRHLEKESQQLYRDTEYAVVGIYGGVGLGDAGHIPGPMLKRTPGIRKFDEWYMAHLLYPNYIKEVYDYQVEIAIKNLELYKQAVGERIQAILISGTDFGTQKSEFMSADMFREFYAPRYQKVNDWVHQNTTWKTFYHTCGSVVRLLDEFVDMGMDILNPVQCSAVGMDPKFLKEKYGDKLVFWGGGIDTQKTLPFGAPGEVRQEAKERLEIFSKNGGYIFNPIHNIQLKTPVENIIAFYEAAKEFNRVEIRNP